MIIYGHNETCYYWNILFVFVLQLIMDVLYLQCTRIGPVLIVLWCAHHDSLVEVK